MKSRMLFKLGPSAVVAALLLAGCAGPQVPAVTPADASRAAVRWPGTEIAQLDHGRSLFVAHCGSCHLPPSPASLAADRWPAQVQEMRERAGLSVGEATLVEQYLITVASR